MSAMHSWLCPSPLLVAVVWLLALTVSNHLTAVSAEKYVVMDADGSIEDYAAVATVLQHPDYSSRLRLITVSGTTWGYGPTVVRNLCRFVAMADASSFTSVALGAVASSSDEYSTAKLMGGCASVQGFPSTPHDAELRGMSYCRADVTSAYGETYTLPHIKTSSASCSYTIESATNAFLTLLRTTDSERDTIVYLQLSSATNLATFAQAVQAQGSPSLLAKFYSVVEVHIFETGYNGGADSTSMAEILSAYNTESQRLRVRLYPPSFYNPSVTFSYQSWSTLGTLANTAGTAKAVTWLYSAWAKKKALLDAKNEGDSVAFFKERGPASSLVVLCALDSSLTNLCQSYRAAVTKLDVVAVKAPTPSNANESVISVSGNNVTVPFYYMATASTDEETTASSSYVYSVPAGNRVGSNTQSLVEMFWVRWFNVLGL